MEGEIRDGYEKGPTLVTIKADRVKGTLSIVEVDTLKKLTIEEFYQILKKSGVFVIAVAWREKAENEEIASKYGSFARGVLAFDFLSPTMTAVISVWAEDEDGSFASTDEPILALGGQINLPALLYAFYEQAGWPMDEAKVAEITCNAMSYVVSQIIEEVRKSAGGAGNADVSRNDSGKMDNEKLPEG